MNPQNLNAEQQQQMKVEAHLKTMIGDLFVQIAMLRARMEELEAGQAARPPLANGHDTQRETLNA
jgi:hypothetical protein